jgi:uncharacterized repeat protein (TIGR01451 family)
MLCAKSATKNNGRMRSRAFTAIACFLILFSQLALGQTRIGPPVPDLSCAIPAGPSNFLTVAITRLVEFEGTNIDGGWTGFFTQTKNRGDFYAKLTVNGATQDSFMQRIEGGSINCGGFGIGCIFPPNSDPIAEYGPNRLWQFTRALPLEAGGSRSPVHIEIEIWDNDSSDRRGDDIADLNPQSNRSGLALNLDPTTGQVTGDLTSAQGCTSGFERFGRVDRNPVQICFEISSLADSDGDGLFDVWEKCGLDPDESGPMTKIDLPGFGANPMHKDLFVELDWMTGQEPTQAAVRALKEAFALAPVDSGIRASELQSGLSAKPNPDLRPGINLLVDTGNLTDASGNMVGDNLGGGNAIDTAAAPAAPICGANDEVQFNRFKNDNFNPGRKFIFRYGISAPGCTSEDGAGPGTCSDGIDNGMDGLVDNGIKDPDPDCDNRSWGEKGGNDFLLRAAGGFPAVLMHELGHNLNLHHGGDVESNCKPNYVSVMNYSHSGLSGIPQAFKRSVIAESSFFSSIVDFSPPRFGIEGSGLRSCADGKDNDSDGLIDGEDPDCLSRGAAPLPRLQEDNLDESSIPDPADPVNQFVFSDASGKSIVWPLNGDRDGDGKPDGVDWNRNGRPPLVEDGFGVFTIGGKQVPLVPGTCMDGIDNGGMDGIDAEDPDCRHDTMLSGLNIDNVNTIRECVNTSTGSELTGFDDWIHISIPFLQFGYSADGAVIPPAPGEEPTLEELIQTEQEKNTTDLAITKARARAHGGFFHLGDITYQLNVINKGPNPAGRVELVDVLPPEVSHKSNTAGCVEAPDGTLTCDLGALLPGEQRQIEIIVRLGEGEHASVPASITNTATVKNIAEFAGADPEPADNSASVTTTLYGRNWRRK